MALRTETGSLQSHGDVVPSGMNVALPDVDLMFTGEYSRIGGGLVLTGLLESAFCSGEKIEDLVEAMSDGSGNTTVVVDINGTVDGQQFTDIAVLQGVQAGVDVAVRIVDVNVV